MKGGCGMNKSVEDFDMVTLDVKSILDRVQEFHGQNGQESMTRIIDSGQGDFNKWPVALVHSISMKFIFDALGQQQIEIAKLKTQLEELNDGKPEARN